MKLVCPYDTMNCGVINAINIENGELNYFSENTLVTPLNAEINLYKY